MEKYCHVKFDAFRRLGEGKYVYSRVLLRGMSANLWTATIWLKHGSLQDRLARTEGTAIVVDRNDSRASFTSSGSLIQYLIEDLGYIFLFNNLEESR